jgi:hypothetical protein
MCCIHIMKTKTEKLKLAAQLLDQDKSYRVIAKRTHLSLNDISALKKQKFGDEKSQASVAEDSKCTEAYKLYKQKKYKLIDVAIELAKEATTRNCVFLTICLVYDYILLKFVGLYIIRPVHKSLVPIS